MELCREEAADLGVAGSEGFVLFASSGGETAVLARKGRAAIVRPRGSGAHRSELGNMIWQTA